jgi:hypothetical protein
VLDEEHPDGPGRQLVRRGQVPSTANAPAGGG